MKDLLKELGLPIDVQEKVLLSSPTQAANIISKFLKAPIEEKYKDLEQVHDQYAAKKEGQIKFIESVYTPLIANINSIKDKDFLPHAPAVFLNRIRGYYIDKNGLVSKEGEGVLSFDNKKVLHTVDDLVIDYINQVNATYDANASRKAPIPAKKVKFKQPRPNQSMGGAAAAMLQRIQAKQA